MGRFRSAKPTVETGSDARLNQIRDRVDPGWVRSRRVGARGPEVSAACVPNLFCQGKKLAIPSNSPLEGAGLKLLPQATVSKRSNFLIQRRSRVAIARRAGNEDALGTVAAKPQATVSGPVVGNSRRGGPGLIPMVPPGLRAARSAFGTEGSRK